MDRRDPSPAETAGFREFGLAEPILLALDDVELNTLTLRQGFEALALDRGVVDEAILLSVLGRDETEALRVVEPLHTPFAQTRERFIHHNLDLQFENP